MKLIMDGNGNIYTSIADAERKTGIKHQNISAVIKGKRFTAGGMTWTRVTDKDVEANSSFEDFVDKAARDIQRKKKGGTPRQRAAAAKARAARKKYADFIEKARSVGVLWYHAKELGEKPTNKELHELNMKVNPDYVDYYKTLTESDGEIHDVDLKKLDW